MKIPVLKYKGSGTETEFDHEKRYPRLPRFFKDLKCYNLFLIEQMEESDEIRGRSRIDILEQLVEDKTLVQMHLLEGDHKWLTLVTGIRTQKSTPFMLVDCPEGFKEAFADLEEWRFRFEFTGKDMLQYEFRTDGGEIFRDEIRIRLPEVIKRSQRRGHYRLEVPRGTKLYLQVNSVKREIMVVNASLGGILGPIVDLEKATEDEPVFKRGETLKHIQLEFPSEEEDLRVYIKKAEVIRWEEGLGGKARYHYAIQFIDMDKTEEIKLVELIYRFQREFLRKRLPMER